MNRSPRPRHRLALLAAVIACAALGFAPAADAALPSKSTNCTEATGLSKPFLPWLDLANYTLSPGGDMEGAMAGWTLSGGAATVAGNETHYVRSKADERSLALPVGSSALSAPMCVGLGHPTMRFFQRNTGSVLGLMKIDVVGVGLLGDVRSLLSIVAVGGKSWTPSLPVLLVSNLTGLFSSDGMTPVAFRFTPLGGNWRIDDVYVDPYRRN